MIVGNLYQSEVSSVSSIVKSLAKLAMSKYEDKEESYKVTIIDGLVFANFDVSLTQPRNERKYEFHKDFLDLHLMINGEELIGFSPKLVDDNSNLIESFELKKDLGFIYENAIVNDNSVVIKPGDYAIFYPYELHQPLVATNSLPIKVKKLVLKVHKSLLN